ncbi:hypothetical protein AB0I82_23830 [Streptomyces sp. NPDC050315]|uniref:hypothetical protein n=1 Tax=Streptomyces sp. NPDC050315 TaxID=3155039 RepID=UPI00343D81EA
MAEQWSVLVGAGGALLGVALTGGFTLLKGRQDNTEKQRDRIEQRRVALRETRRTTYVRFLSAYHEVDSKFLDAWKIRPALLGATPSPQLLDVLASATALREVLTEIALDGPPEVSAAAYDLYGAVWDTATLLNRLVTEHADSEQHLFRLSDMGDGERERTAAQVRFVQAASTAIGGNLPGLFSM